MLAGRDYAAALEETVSVLASDRVKDLMTAPSMGRALNRKGQMAWPNSRHLNSEGKVDEALGRMDRNIGQWGRAHYADDWASLG